MMAALMAVVQLALNAAPATPVLWTPQAIPDVFTHVVVVSIDGLRPDAIDDRADGPTPALARVLRGPGTLNARCDPENSITLPNHVSMLTGRFTGGDAGHGWVDNADPPAIRHGGTLLESSTPVRG